MITIGFIGIGGALLFALAVAGINALIHQMKSDTCRLVSNLTDGTVTTFLGESTPVSEQILQSPKQRALLVKGAEVIVRHGMVVDIVSSPATTMTSLDGERQITRTLATGDFAQSEPPLGA